MVTIHSYTFRAPGQATSYYHGYMRFNALRTRVELAQAGRFDQLAFHGFIVNQGLLPLALREQAVMTEFVPAKPSRYFFAEAFSSSRAPARMPGSA